MGVDVWETSSAIWMEGMVSGRMHTDHLCFIVLYISNPLSLLLKFYDAPAFDADLSGWDVSGKSALVLFYDVISCVR